jgi:hypothetical protein
MSASQTSRRLRRVAGGLLAVAVIAETAQAQQPTDLSRTEIKVTRVAPDFYLLAAAFVTQTSLSLGFI